MPPVAVEVMQHMEDLREEKLTNPDFLEYHPWGDPSSAGASLTEVVLPVAPVVQNVVIPPEMLTPEMLRLLQQMGLPGSATAPVDPGSSGDLDPVFTADHQPKHSTGM